MKGVIYMECVIVNVIKKARQVKAVVNMYRHNAQFGIQSQGLKE